MTNAIFSKRCFVGLVAVLLCLPHAGAGAGTVKGTVTVKKEKKPKRPSRYHLGPYRSARRAGGQREGGPQDVVISLEGEGLKGVRKPSGTLPPAAMRQKGEEFIPHVLPVQVGTAVEFPNEDDFYHNVFSVMAGDRFDLGRYARGESARQVFSKPGVVVVRCEIHAGMKAYIVVLDTPCFTTADETGNFALSDVPAGTYTLKAWHPTQGEQTRAVEVPESGEVEVALSF